ncbi:MAG: hypothetical protein EZS28_033589 [Streblomastix strix]|uniref:Uncharacterized protein n=1 Tax=Streblomastix strix TaxID=222440 RepID=A0A5J4UMB7_9EUKA|nr:MAG: hypothetical protein EZS28_033589 [Streblomastix strix]
MTLLIPSNTDCSGFINKNNNASQKPINDGGQSSLFLFASDVIILTYYTTAVSTPTIDITQIVLSPIYNRSQLQFNNTISISIFSQFSHIHPPFLQILFHIFPIQFPVLFSHSKIAGTGVNAIFISPSLKSFASKFFYS